MRVFVLLCCFILSPKLFAVEQTILILGDSLSASYGIPVESGWVSLLQQRLEQQGYNSKVINASISGETTFGALVRIDDLIRTQQPDIAVIELGGNDGLRGITVDEMQNNLSEIITTLKQSGALIVLTKMTLPPNYGKPYIKKFESVYDDLGQTHAVPVSSFIVDAIAANPALMQADGIHPTAEAQPLILDKFWPVLLPIISDSKEHEEL